MAFFYAANIDRELECPECGETNDVKPNQEQIECSHCHAKLDVDIDAEFVDGRWHDCSRLYLHKS